MSNERREKSEYAVDAGVGIESNGALTILKGKGRGRRKTLLGKYPLANMSVGDSFFIPYSEDASLDEIKEEHTKRQLSVFNACSVLRRRGELPSDFKLTSKPRCASEEPDFADLFEAEELVGIRYWRVR